jgi:hypothetical protein
VADESLTTNHSLVLTAFLIATDDPMRIGILSDHRESKELSPNLTEKHAHNKKAKKRLIATHANSEIPVSHSQQKTSHFLTRLFT